jgi:hypothetical protein
MHLVRHCGTLVEMTLLFEHKFMTQQHHIMLLRRRVLPRTGLSVVQIILTIYQRDGCHNRAT